MKLTHAGLYVLPVIAIGVGFSFLRDGAKREVRFARLYAAGEHPDEPLLFTLATGLEYRGLLSPVGNVHGSLEITTRRSSSTTSHAEEFISDADGYATIRRSAALERPEGAFGVRITDGDGALLASGDATLPNPPPPRTSAPRMLRPTEAKGALRIEVGGRDPAIAAGGAGELDVRVTDAATAKAITGAHLTIEPDPGVAVTQPAAPTCADGWTRLAVTPSYHIASLKIVAKDAGGQEGSWYGAIPVAAGAALVESGANVDRGWPGLTVRPRTDVDVRLSGPSLAREREYFALYSASSGGRLEAGSVTFEEPLRTGEITLPWLEAGGYFLWTGGSPLDEGSIDNGGLVRFVRVGDAVPAACPLDLGGLSADPAGIGISLVLDGTRAAIESNVARGRGAKGRSLRVLAAGAIAEAALALFITRRSGARAMLGAACVVAAAFFLLAAFVWFGA